MTETYARMMVTWSKKVEQMENSKKRREREAKSRELYEKIFPELKKQNKDKKMHSYAAVIPALEERQRKCTSDNGLILDLLKEFNDRKFQNMWTDAEKDIFKKKFFKQNFGLGGNSIIMLD